MNPAPRAILFENKEDLSFSFRFLVSKLKPTVGSTSPTVHTFRPAVHAFYGQNPKFRAKTKENGGIWDKLKGISSDFQHSFENRVKCISN